MYTLLVHPDEPTTISTRVSNSYRTASVTKRAAVSRVHAVVVYRVQKRVNTNVAAPMD